MPTVNPFAFYFLIPNSSRLPDLVLSHLQAWRPYRQSRAKCKARQANWPDRPAANSGKRISLPRNPACTNGGQKIDDVPPSLVFKAPARILCGKHEWHRRKIPPKVRTCLICPAGSIQHMRLHDDYSKGHPLLAHNCSINAHGFKLVFASVLCWIAKAPSRPAPWLRRYTWSCPAPAMRYPRSALRSGWRKSAEPGRSRQDFSRPRRMSSPQGRGKPGRRFGWLSVSSS